MQKLITILGPTATGKTEVAAHLAYKINGEIISADSRQVYREMTIGTGKDLQSYVVNDKNIPYHLIDICEPGEKFNLYKFIELFNETIDYLEKKQKTPILCGGTALYIHAVLKRYPLVENSLSKEAINTIKKSLEVNTLKKYDIPEFSMINDLKQKIRAIKNIENGNEIKILKAKETDFKVFGIYFERDIIKKRITERLISRLKNGMIEEVKNLLEKGLSFEKLEYYGLEYRYIGRYLNNKISYEEMFNKLNIAIHQFAKRQMTFFRKMEREGIKIDWIDGNLSIENKVLYIEKKIKGWL